MQLATRLGDAASPLKMPKARVAWEYDLRLKRRQHPLPATFSDPNDNLIYVSGEPGEFRKRANDRNRTVVRHEWEMAAIAHEYGHLLVSHNAWPGNSKGQKHVFTGAYPDDPILPYDEGFANAFASMAMKTAAPTLNCEPLWDLGADPPTPAIEPADMVRYAQHNEIAVAAAVYRLTALLGDRDQTAGLRKLLTALRTFEARAGRAPSRMRELHDAVVLSGAAAAPGKDLGDRLARIDGLFGDLGMAWGGGADADFRAPFDDGSFVGTSANNRTGLRLDGRGGVTCVAGDDHSVDYGPLPGGDTLPFSGHLAAGPLGATWIDDCLARVVVHHSVRLPYPFSADLSHLTGSWTISAFYSCTPGTPPPPDPEDPDPHPEAYACRGSISVPATATRDYAAYELCQKAFWCSSGLGGTPDPGLVSIPNGGSVVLMRFDAYGGCDLHPALLAAGSGYGCHL
jgi:hypothetical protein